MEFHSDTLRHRADTCPIEDRWPVSPMLSSMSDTLTWLTLSDAAAQLSVSTRTVERRIAAGALRSRYTETGRVMVGIEPTDRPPQAQAVAAVMATAEGSRQAALALFDALPAINAAYDAARSAVEARATAAERNAWWWRMACLTACLPSVIAVAALSWTYAGAGRASYTVSDTPDPAVGDMVPAARLEDALRERDGNGATIMELEYLLGQRLQAAPNDWHPPLNP